MNRKYLQSLLLFLIFSVNSFPQDFRAISPDGKINLFFQNGDVPAYSIEYDGRTIIQESTLGFEFKTEPAMHSGFEVIEKNERTFKESWEPVVSSKHAVVINHFNELQLVLKESSGLMRIMEVSFRVFNDGVAFRTKLFRSERVGDRQLTGELTTFKIPGNPKAWVVEYGGYSSSNESEFFERPLSYVSDQTIAGLPFLMDYGDSCCVAITEAGISNYPGFYIGTKGSQNTLSTKLAPLPGEDGEGVKARFDDEVFTPWRVIMIGKSPGSLVESDIVLNLNEPCAIEDPSWIVPGKSAWDHWWSGEVKMEMPVIKQYIDFASQMDWPYMLVDWQWYGPFSKPEADITKWATQIDMPEIISYARSKDVKIILWLYSSDVNRNSAYKTAFPLYRKWGVGGVKIDFMDRDDQDMVNWYHDIIQCAAENHLLVDFHGAYKPDGIRRTYPNMITREGVMGNEYYKFSENMSPEHNIKLAYTRMLAGPMDYTPGAFLNVTKENFTSRVPTVVWNTRAAELSKFVIYESPLTVVCDHPDHIQNQPGADFVKQVPTTWDDIHFIGGYPGEYVAIARKSGKEWYVGVMNNSEEKEIMIDLDFLSDGEHQIETWADNRDSGKKPDHLKVSSGKVRQGESIKIKMAKNGGWVARIQ